MQRQSKPHNEAHVNIGIDVSKASLDICILPGGKQMKMANDSKAHKALITQLAPYKVALIVIEATGKYHLKLHQALAEARFAVAVINPYRSRKFADSWGQLAKTDKIDARMLALFGERMRPPSSIVPTDLMMRINEMVQARTSLVADQSALKNRLAVSNLARLHRLFKKRLRNLATDIARLEKDILFLIGQNEKLARRLEVLMSIPGIGLITAMTLIAAMPELGNANNKQIAALTGVAPMNWDSGTMRAKRAIKGGRFEVRRALYMPAMSVATRSSGTMHDFYQAMIKRGKPAKVAITAVMRKLIILANTLIKKDCMWKENYA
jgi:transposase